MTSRKKIYIILLLSLDIAILNLVVWRIQHPQVSTSLANLRLDNRQVIAHAMGSIDGFDYTNSEEAFISNYKKGFRIFEVDLLLLKDNRIAAFHSLDSVIKEFGVKRHIRDYSHDEFIHQKIRGRYRPLDMNRIIEFATNYTDARFILDLKDSNDRSNDEDLVHGPDSYEKLMRQLVGEIKRKAPQSISHFIPQIYAETDIEIIRKIHPFNEVIYTLFRTKSTDQDIFQFVKRFSEIRYVAFEKHRYSPLLVKELAEIDVKSLIYVVNDLQEAYRFSGAYGFYTDIIPPSI